MVKAIKSGIVKEFGEVQWGLLSTDADGTKDGWQKLEDGDARISNKPFVPKELLSKEPAAKAEANAGETNSEQPKTEKVKRSRKKKSDEVN